MLYSGRYDPSKLGFHPLEDSSLNRTHAENCYILGYKGPNEILEDVPIRGWNLISVFLVLESEYEIVTCGILYNFDVLNSLVTGHIGKMIISPNW